MPRKSTITAPIQFRASILPALQAFFTASATAFAILLVILWRPHRPRFIPFYSDATHNDPERIILAIGENLACFFMPLVAAAEFTQQARLALRHPRPSAPLVLRPFIKHVSTRMVVHANFFVTASTTLFFFITANVPSKYPYTPPHQFAASALILCYAIQATFKTILAHTFANYQMESCADIETGEKTGSLLKEEKLKLVKADVHHSNGTSWWTRYHIPIRLLLAATLWLSLIMTWFCYIGRLILKHPGRQYEAIRQILSSTMAVIVHIATVSCVTIMAIMAVDLRRERVVIYAQSE